MATYKDASLLKMNTSTAFDQHHTPGTIAPFAGIYRCVGCGHEIGIAEGHVLPPQGHPQHPTNKGPIRWQLIVYAEHNK